MCNRQAKSTNLVMTLLLQHATTRIAYPTRNDTFISIKNVCTHAYYSNIESHYKVVVKEIAPEQP